MSNRILTGSCPYRNALILICLACLMLLVDSTSVKALTTTGLPPDQVDWVCVTDASLAEAFAPLADHRLRQDLSCRVVTTGEVASWAGEQPDLMAALRWFAGAAHDEWGTRYLLLGGDQHLVPAPPLRVEVSTFVFSAPVDLYYSCLGGDWDADGDGWVAEWNDDQPDWEPQLAVGRLPVADAVEAGNVVAKTIAYERSDQQGGDAALLAATVLNDLWMPGQEPVFMAGIMLAEAVGETLHNAPDPLQTTAMYQYVDATPGALELTPEAFIEELRLGNHDFALFHGQGDPGHWSCGEFHNITVAMTDQLAGTGHTFFMDALSCEAADISAEGILEHLTVLPDGGAVAARGHASCFYVTPGHLYADVFWELFADAEHPRLGDLQNAALVEAHDRVPLWSVVHHLTHFSQMILGDPALILRPVLMTGTPTVAEGIVNPAVAPNPFNPSVEITFDLVGRSQTAIHTRVQIFDLRGRLLATPLDKVLPPGPQRVEWNTADEEFGSGVYFARITASDHEAVVRMVMIE